MIRRRLRRAGLLGVALVAAGALTAACGSSTPSGTSGSGSSKLFMIPKFTGIPPFTQADQGGAAMAKTYGYKLTYNGPSTGSATDQVNFINQAAGSGYNGIFISADDPATVTPALQKAMKHGMKVVSFDSDVLPAGRNLFVEGTSTADIAKSELQMLGSQIGYSGNFVILSAQATDTNQVDWNNQLKQDLKTDKQFANMKLDAIINPPDDGAPSAATYMQNIIARYPNIKGVIAPTTVAIAAAAQVLQQRHLCSKIVLTGLGDPQQMKPFVTSGCVKQFGLWNFSREGQVAMCAMHGVLSGSLTGKTGQSFTCGSLGKFTVGPQQTVPAGPIEVFTKNNLSAYTF
jgi:rhamnose transport system substrate-binding protein